VRLKLDLGRRRVDPEGLRLKLGESFGVMDEIVRLMFDLGQRRDETARWIPKFGRVRVETKQLLEL